MNALEKTGDRQRKQVTEKTGDRKQVTDRTITYEL
jgi:hypothetical protein